MIAPFGIGAAHQWREFGKPRKASGAGRLHQLSSPKCRAGSIAYFRGLRGDFACHLAGSFFLPRGGGLLSAARGAALPSSAPRLGDLSLGGPAFLDQGALAGAALSKTRGAAGAGFA
jgi:hypothetical protein